MVTASSETARRPLSFASLAQPSRLADTAAKPLAGGRRLTLARKQVLTIPRRSGVRAIEVLRGTLWLTATPADRDVLLNAGERFQFGPDAPFVIEALADADIVLHG